MDLHELLLRWMSPLISAAALGYAVVAGRGKAAKEEQGILEARISAVERDQADVRSGLAKMELTVKHLPTSEQFQNIQLSFAALSGDMKVLTAFMARVEKHLERES